MYQPVVAEPSKIRPGSVTMAGYLLYLVALSELVQAVMGIAAYGQETDAYVAAVNQAAADQHKVIKDPTPLVHTLVTAQVVVAVVIAALFVVMGVYVLRGRQGMRI